MTHKDLAIKLAKEAGKMILANFSLGMDRIQKPDGSPVTITDLTINSLVIKEVKKNFPTHDVIGEEESYRTNGKEFVWVCDPVDGTIPFSHGMPTCMFSLALVRNGEPILAVAYDPFMGRMFFAEKGKGAFLNGKKIKASQKKELKGSFVSVGVWSIMPFPTPKITDELVFKEKANSFTMGSVVYNACLLAAGEIDAVVLGANTTHDVAAVDLIVREAGGKTSDFSGKSQRYDQPVKGWIGASPYLFPKILKMVKKVSK